MTRPVLRVLASGACAVLLAGCGAQSSPPPAAEKASSSEGSTHRMDDGTVMTDAEMKEHGEAGRGGSGSDEDTPAPGAVTHREDGPSGPAAMICSREIAASVQRTFALRALPRAVDAWSASDRLYSCTYAVGGSRLRLSVKDLDEATAGRAYFDALRTELGARPVRGLQNLGFPALQTGPQVGDVAFLKDHKTLRVDAGDVSPADLPPGFSRTGAAYGIASSVIACWTE